MKGFFFFFFQAFIFPSLIVNFIIIIFWPFLINGKIKSCFFATIDLDHSLVSWKLKTRGPWNKFVYCVYQKKKIRILHCALSVKSKNRKLLCSVIYFHSLVSWKLQKRGTAFTHERLFFQSVHTLPQMFLDGKPKTRDTLHCCCQTNAKCQLTIPLHTPTL